MDILQPSAEKLVLPLLSSPVAGAVGMPLSGSDLVAALKSPVLSTAKQLRPSDGSNKISPPGIGGGTAQVSSLAPHFQETLHLILLFQSNAAV